MTGQGEMSRIGELGKIIHNSRSVFGKDYGNRYYTPAHPATVVIGKEPACSSRERRQARKELKNLIRHSLDEEVRNIATQEIKRSNDFTPHESDSRAYNDFFIAHPILEGACFIGLYWASIAAGIAFIYGTAKLYSHFYGQ